jgi:nitrous oxidase accessory protein
MLEAIWLVALLAQAQAPAATSMALVDSGRLEGRPPAAERSPLQGLVDAASAGALIEVAAGEYAGDLYIDRPIRLVGRGRPRLVGSGAGSVVRVRADDVTIEGFDIDGRGGGDLAADSAGVHVAARRVAIRNCRIVRSLFGVYLREANEALVEHSTIDGMRGQDPGEQGSGIHLWNTTSFRLLDNRIRYSRDGFYLQSSTRGLIARNVVTEVRYGLHYMFSDDNVFEDNVFERSAAGAALMYSKRLTFRRNRFVHNRGFSAVGLLLKACDQVAAENNLIADNARGIFLEGSYANTFRGNVVAKADAAVIVYDSSHGNRFEENAFISNLTPLQLVGRRTDTRFDRNFWSDARGFDLDGDGISDRPHRLSNVFDHLRGNLTAADLMAQSLGAAVLGVAEDTFPVLDAVPVEDAHPLMRAPVLPGVPAASLPTTESAGWGLAGSAAGLGLGLLVLWSGRRPHQ